MRWLCPVASPSARTPSGRRVAPPGIESTAEIRTSPCLHMVISLLLGHVTSVAGIQPMPRGSRPQPCRGDAARGPGQPGGLLVQIHVLDRDVPVGLQDLEPPLLLAPVGLLIGKELPLDRLFAG